MNDSAFVDKIRPEHLDRKAIVYVRQSSEEQVRKNRESTRIQYALAEKARSPGWSQPLVIDEDLGKSAAGDSERSGFQSLVTQVGIGDVGIVISFEATRLARNNRDWYQLIDLCAIFGTLLGDHATIYDPSDPNDRMLLGMKGTMSEAELNMIKLRMHQGRMSKARRGKLYYRLPPGYELAADGELVKSADSRERRAVALVFEKFEEFGSARQVFKWFCEEGIQVPVTDGNKNDGKKRRWQLPKYGYILHMMHNPVYAGAYAYGMSESRTAYSENRIKKTAGHLKPRDQWDVLIKDHHEAYISWDRYEKNVEKMGVNQNVSGIETVGAARKGKGLLAGLLRCRRCGRKLNVRYWGKSGVNPRYLCTGQYWQGGHYCLSFAGTKTDAVFENELFRAIEPAAIRASISARENLGEKHDAKIECLEKQLEQARYEADRAFRQYDRTEPENRLVAAELESRWNDRLKQVKEVEDRVAKEKERLPNPSPEDIEAIASIPDNFAEVWRHPETDPSVKKQIARILVEEVLVDHDEETNKIHMTIHWKGGVHTQVEFRKPSQGDPHRAATDQSIVQLLKRLAPHYADEEIARIFNCHKFKTGKGNRWTRHRIRDLRSYRKIAPFDRRKRKSTVSLNEAARLLDVSTYAVRRLIAKKLIHAEQIVRWAPFRIEKSELEKKTVQKAVLQLKQGSRLKQIQAGGKQLTFC